MEQIPVMDPGQRKAMHKRISKTRFTQNTLELLRHVQRTGEDLIITEHGEPVLKIVPYSEDPPESLKALRNSVLKYDRPLQPVGIGDWRTIR